MKTVYNSDMVCHLWANKHANDVRTSSRNLYTERGALFSYGSHFVIAAHLDAPKSGAPFILWNDESATNTTNKHRSQAFRALSSKQRAELVRVSVRVYAESLGANGLQDLARACINAAAKPLQKCEKARGNFATYASEAARAFEAARRLFEYTGNTKAARAVPSISENPTKADAARVLVEINRAEILEHANTARAASARCLELAKADAAEYGKHAWVTARSVWQNATRSTKSASEAREHFKRAAVRVPSDLSKFEREARAIIAEFETRAQTEAENERRADILKAARDLVREMARFNNAKRRGMEPERTNRANRLRARGLDVSWRLNCLNDRLGFAFFESADAARIFPNAAEISELARIFKRAERISETDALRGQIAHLAEAVRDLDARTARGFAPPNAREVRARLRFERTPDFWRAKAEAVCLQADAARAAYAEAIIKKNAETVNAWKRGEMVHIPSGLPDLARVRGDIVETSRGASVPLAHAVRLVRLARIVAAKGGAEYTNENAPRVGHFKVESIGADLSAVIGCHAFEASEAARICAIIEQHADACKI